MITGTVDELIPKMLKMDRDKKYQLVEYKEKRSLNANDYFWVLCTKIANVLRASKDEIHDKMIREYGQVASAILPLNIDIKGYCKYYDEIRTLKQNSVLCKEYRLYKGSSEMNTEEMSILIDGVVYEAKELGIPTIDDIKMERLINEWDKKYGNQ